MFDVESALTGLAALMTTIPEIQLVGIGAPESLGAQVVGWVTVGDPGNIGVPITGVAEMPVTLIAWFGYAVAGSEENAEWKLGRYLSELTRRLIQNRIGTVGGVTRNLNGAADRMGLPVSAAGASDYATFAGAEVRVYPVGVTIVQRENF